MNHGVQEIYIDNVSVGDAYNKDLAIKLNAPSKAIAGENCTASARIYNYGTVSAKNFTVKLYADGKEIASKTEKTTLKAQKIYIFPLRSIWMLPVFRQKWFMMVMNMLPTILAM